MQHINISIQQHDRLYIYSFKRVINRITLLSFHSRYHWLRCEHGRAMLYRNFNMLHVNLSNPLSDMYNFFVFVKDEIEGSCMCNLCNMNKNLHNHNEQNTSQVYESLLNQAQVDSTPTLSRQ